MITGTLDNLAPIAELGGNFLTAVSFLKNLDIDSLTTQRYEIDGANVFATFYNVTLGDPTTLSFETHTHYADIQLIVGGCEGMWVASASDGLTIRTSYEAERDVTFYEDPVRAEELAVMPNHFVVFMPEDAHKPSCKTKNYEYSRKLVVKVKID